MSTNGRMQIVILGGGFGGIYTAMHLEKRKRSRGVKFTRH
jgi:NADH dehydrogenase FAD-containing subunit